MINILFLINTLGGGGAEKALINLVNYIDPSRFRITVETMFDDGVNVPRLHPDIRYISKKAPCPRGIAYVFRLFSAKQLYRYFIGNEKYDILVAYMHGAPVKVISGCPDPKVRKIAWLHNGNPETGTFFKFWMTKKAAFRAYENCAAVVGVSRSVSEAFARYTGIEDVKTVYNTCDVDLIRSLAEQDPPFRKDNDKKYLVSVGRISEEKGYDRFFEVCRRLYGEGYPLDVTVVGTGDKEDELKKRIAETSVGDWFHLAGFQENPYPYVANADLFVCPSYQEGLSTAVAEAVILGVPVVSTDVSGAKEILGEHDEYGLVTQNSEEGLYEGVKKMLSDENLRAYYRQKSSERAGSFAPENTVKQAEELFRSVLV
ncbi:MAG: glycosyltransferase [Clostridia bacterium]|nr:glycosyltransferase [Clostridia bacterium]